MDTIKWLVVSVRLARTAIAILAVHGTTCGVLIYQRVPRLIPVPGRPTIAATREPIVGARKAGTGS